MVIMISPADWMTKGKLVEVGQHKIFAIDSKTPDKDVIVLIHGFPTASWDWAKIWKELSQNYRLIAMDMLGFGFSDKPIAHTYSIMEQADIVEAVVEQFALDQIHIFAHDYGDTVAQELLARQLDGSGVGQWKSVCFLNGGLFPETHRALLIQKLLLSPLGPVINKLSSKSRFQSSMSRTFGPKTKPTDKEIDAFWSLINQNNGRHVFHKLITYMSDRQRYRERWVDALKNSTIPIGLINGSHDPVSGAHMVEHYKKTVGAPHFLLELPEIGHYPHVEAPTETIEGYQSFQASF